MKILRYLIGIPTMLILGLIAFVLALPAIFHIISLKIYAIILRLVCWAAGRHSYDVYSTLVMDNIQSLRCLCCQTLIPEKDIAYIIEQRDILSRQINLVAQHLQATKENDEVSDELSKLE